MVNIKKKRVSTIYVEVCVHNEHTLLPTRPGCEEHCASKLVAHSIKICIIHDQKTLSYPQLHNLPTPPSTPFIT
jgi:hypothetical protein